MRESRQTLWGPSGLVLTVLTCFGTIISVAHAETKIGVVLDRGGKDDKSFNASAYKGATQAQKELGVTIKVVESSDDNAFEPLLRALAQKKFDLIIGIGIAQAEAVNKVAKQFPQSRFAIVDSEVNLPNVRSLLFEEHLGSFLVGALAGLTSKTGKVGFIGGMDVPLIRRFELGFIEGARTINPKIKTVSNFVGVTTDAWNNPPKAKELALGQYESGVDVIFAAAGASGAGLFDAAEERTRKSKSTVYAIGVDSNQNWIKPGLVLTSMLKRVDLAVFSTISDVVNGKWSGGVVRYGLDGVAGVDWALDEFNSKLITPATKARMDQIRKDLISGKIKVSDYYKK